MKTLLDPISGRLVDLALEEDLSAGDPTTSATIDPQQEGSAALVAREACVLSGLAVAEEVFRRVDPSLRFEVLRAEGDRLCVADLVARIRGKVASILMAERTALNFLRHLSGVATQAARFVEAAGPAGARVVDTRKTTPGMRALEKAAVRAGGARNHRFSLGDGVLIKDNHIVSAGSVGAAVRAARAKAHHLLRIEVEVADERGLREAIEARADVVMLDNMSPEQVRACVALADGAVILEASGGVSLETVGAYAATGVDLVSVGALVHSARDADLALDLSPIQPESDALEGAG